MNNQRDPENNTRGRLVQKYNCRIYQDLNPLSLNPLILKTGSRYRQQNGANVNHLLYMDDLKLYASHE